MNTEDYVSYEQAIKLKELGFDWEVNHYYKDKRLIEIYGNLSNYKNVNENYVDGCYSAPTLAQAQKWLREKGIFLHIKPLVTKSLCVFEYIIDRMDTIDRIESKPQFNTYEQALSAGIDNALERLKEEKNDN